MGSDNAVMRHKEDWRLLLTLGLASALAAWQWTHPATRLWLLPLGAYFALASGLVGHVHNHSPAFRHRTLNHLLSYWSMFFYGVPPYLAWIANHNQNHHKYGNGPGDATSTWRYTNRHNLFTAVAYPFINIYHQSPVVNAFIAKSYRERRWMFWHVVAQHLLIAAVVVAGVLTDPQAVLFAFVYPWALGLFTILYLNYSQHVHCDPYDRYNHSRNFTGWWINRLLFNQGYHTVHHDQPGLHWSRLPEAHARLVAPHIDPSLDEASLPWWLVRNYILSPFWPEAGSHQVGDVSWQTPASADRPWVEA